MITLITGMPGNGKTLYAVDFIAREVEKGRTVYADVEGLKIEGVKPAPDDWRTVEDGALIVYDEAHRRFPAYRGKGRSPLELVREMDTHRHKGIDMWMITQWPDKLDGELFRLVGDHRHLNRAMGLAKAHVYKYSRAVANPYSAMQRKHADEELWAYPKNRYAAYSSSSHHTQAYKFRMPTKVWSGLTTVLGVVLAAWFLYGFFFKKVGGTAEKERSEAEPTTQAVAFAPRDAMPTQAQRVSEAPKQAALPTRQGVGAFAQVNTTPVPTLAGCVSSDRGCRCFNTDGYQIDMTQQECEATLDSPMPFNVYHQFRRAEATASGEKPAIESQPAATSIPAGDRPFDTGYTCDTCDLPSTRAGAM